MTAFYLVRHALTDAVGRTLSGRMPGIQLNAEGRGQAHRLASRLSSVRLDSLFCSPMERTVETAEMLAKTLGLNVQTDAALTEVEFGEWTGRRFEDLQNDPGWQHYNTFRSVSRPPSGENLLDVQHRMVAWSDTMRRRMPDAHILVVSHGDPLKTMIMYYLGLHLEMIRRFEISPASVSLIEVNDFGTSLVYLNQTAA